MGGKGCLRHGVTAMALAFAAGPAFALLAPQYYEKARAEAPNVVIIAVSIVKEPEGPYGDCTVKGQVRQVERGIAFGVGQNVSVGVPCRKPGAKPPVGATLYADPEALRAAPYGRAYLDDKGFLVKSQYEPLPAAPSEPGTSG